MKLIDYVYWPLVVLFAGIVYLCCHCLVTHGGKDCCDKEGCCPPLVKPEPKTPDKGKGLALHQWYRANRDLRWCWQHAKWHPGNGHGFIKEGTPLFVMDRRGHVAVCRGAVHGEVLVPDDSATFFSKTGQGYDLIGDLPDLEATEKADPRLSAF